MQRLFSTFPNSWPGTGLLLLRFALAVPAAADAVWGLLAMQGPWTFTTCAAAALTSTLVLLGLWTPYAAAVLGVTQLEALFLGSVPAQIQLARAAIAASLIMLGPGAWSIDQRLFGRKRIDLPVKQPRS